MEKEHEFNFKDLRMFDIDKITELAKQEGISISRNDFFRLIVITSEWLASDERFDRKYNINTPKNKHP